MTVQNPSWTPQNRPALFLEGERLSGGWIVTELADLGQNPTGGFFSISYLAEKDGETAFVKAFDFGRIFAARSAQPTTSSLQPMLQAYNFERDLVVDRCSRMSRVVRAIEAGEYRSASSFFPVPYLILEFSDAGDVRKYLSGLSGFDLAWTLRALHHIAVGMGQLHNAQIAHQDLKPSNVIFFPEEGSKIGDLGTASTTTTPGARDNLDVVGDHGYAPIEHLYGELSSDWNVRRRAGDLYQLGSMILFLCLDATATALITAELDTGFHWNNWGGTYRDALPHIRQAFDTVVHDFEQWAGPELEDLALVVRWLCEPDPGLRGHPQNRQPGQGQYGLNRIVSKLNFLAAKAEYQMLDRM